jgi:hypothetical protein
MVLALSASRDQSQVVFQYVRGFLEASPILRQEIVNAKASEIELRGNITVAVHSSSYRTLRGKTLLAQSVQAMAMAQDREQFSPFWWRAAQRRAASRDRAQ